VLESSLEESSIVLDPLISNDPKREVLVTSYFEEVSPIKKFCLIVIYWSLKPIGIERSSFRLLRYVSQSFCSKLETRQFCVLVRSKKDEFYNP
jgi:hypothetical protein